MLPHSFTLPKFKMFASFVEDLNIFVTFIYMMRDFHVDLINFGHKNVKLEE